MVASCCLCSWLCIILSWSEICAASADLCDSRVILDSSAAAWLHAWVGGQEPMGPACRLPGAVSSLTDDKLLKPLLAGMLGWCSSTPWAMRSSYLYTHHQGSGNMHSPCYSAGQRINHAINTYLALGPGTDRPHAGAQQEPRTVCAVSQEQVISD